MCPVEGSGGTSGGGIYGVGDLGDGDIGAILAYLYHESFGNDGDYTDNAGYGGDNIGPPGSKEPEKDEDRSSDLLGDLMAPPGEVPGWPRRPGARNEGSREIEPYGGSQAPTGSLFPFTEMDVDVYSGLPLGSENADSFTGLPASDPFAEDERPVRPRSGAPWTAIRPTSLLSSPYLLADNGMMRLDTSQWIASNGPLVTSDAQAGAHYIDVTQLWGAQKIDDVRSATIPGNLPRGSYAHYQVTFEGLTYNAYLNDMLVPNQAWIVPVEPAAPLAAPAQAASPMAAPPTTPLPRRPPEPGWTTQTEWSFPEMGDHPPIPMIRSFDTGNQPLNVVLNNVILPWRNLLAALENTPLIILEALDNAMSRPSNPFQKEYEAVSAMGPMMKTMGLASEIPGGLRYLSYWIAESKTLNSIAPSSVLGAISMGGGLVGGGGGGDPKPVFMRRMLRIINETADHPIKFLVDPTTGDWKARSHLSTEPGVQAGHMLSRWMMRLLGEPDRLAVEDAFFNQLANWVGETGRRAWFTREAVEVEGVVVELETLKLWAKEHPSLRPFLSGPRVSGWVWVK